MSPEHVAIAVLVLQAVQVVQLVPALLWLGRFLWRLDHRLYRVELKLGIASKE